MAGSFNRVLLLGNLTRDIELRHTPSNTAVANVGIAVNRKYKTDSGETKEEVTFVDCEAWGKTAEIMSQYLAKGRPIFIEGRLKLDTWQDKTDGSNRSKLKVVVESFQFVDSRPGGGGEGGAGGVPSRAPAQRSASQGPGGSPQPIAQAHEQIQEEDIPF